MKQSRLSSFYEACMGIVIGFSINFVLNLYMIPMFVKDANGQPAHISPVANWWMGCLYTIVSLARTYAIRRWFNARLHRIAVRLAGGGGA